MILDRSLFLYQIMFKGQYVRMKIIVYLVMAIAAVGMNAACADNEVQVPFVGCPSDGQEGPQPPPTGAAHTIHISSKLPGPIAYYNGVFAPAGWHCLELYGSSGSVIIVSAKSIPSGMPSGSFDAPVIELSWLSGETSGRFDVARFGWMLFPNLSKDVVKSVEDEGIVSKADIETPKYSKDDLTHLSTTLVRFETPANTKGLGSEGYVNVAQAPILGLVSWDDGDDGLGVSILRISMGTKDKTWAQTLLELNTPCLTGNSCQ